MHWWKEIVGYQIYPRTFMDSNEDGIGDLQGIISQLDYLKELGVDAIWVGPFYRSPMIDNGYDISNFYEVDPMFGTLDDIKELIAKLHERGMYLITDLVLNHTSDQHEWFQKACLDPNSKERGYYIWQNPRFDENGKRLPPTNWSGFTGRAWVYHEATNQYYMKIFADQMPDLNWSNPELRQEMFDIAKFWLDLGVDGFRIDAVAHLGKDMSFADIEGPLDVRGMATDFSKYSNRPEVFVYLKEFKEKVLSKYDCVAIGEVGGNANTEAAIAYAGYDEGPLNMVFTFDHCWENGLYGSDNSYAPVVNVIKLKQTFKRWYEDLQGKAWHATYWLNHDHPRIVSHYGNDKEYHIASAKMLCNTLYFMYGTPFVYNGEEIGMTNVDYDSIHDFTDHATKEYIQTQLLRQSEQEVISQLKRTSRDNARTPMQWNAQENAGFSSVTPIHKLHNNHKFINVAQQLDDQKSILRHYQRVLKYRKHEDYKDLIIYGTFALIDELHKHVFAYKRNRGTQELVVLSNFTNQEVMFIYPSIIKVVLAHNYETIIFDGYHFTLRPYESIAYESIPK